MTDKDISLRLESEREKYESMRRKEEHVAYTAALHLPHTVKPLCEKLLDLATDLEAVNVLKPIAAYRALKKARAALTQLGPRYREQYADCLKRLSEPVEGANALDIAWVQGFTSANGVAAILELTTAYRSATETLDRKAAYAMACFSLYVAVVSLTATTAFGWLSIR